LKVQEGICEGEVRYHKYVSKTKEEIEEIKKKRQLAKELKEERRKEQEKRVEAKSGKKQELDDEHDLYLSSQTESDEDDVDWYRKEVGSEPTEEVKDILKSNRHKGKRKRSNSTESTEKNTKKKKTV